MAKNKTNETEVDVIEFINNLPNEKRKDDSYALLEFFSSLTGCEPKMWGPTIIGFGKYHYRYKTGHEGDAPLAAFAPRKDSLVLYIANEFEDRELLLSQLGKFKVSKACIYAKKLEDLDQEILKKIIYNSMEWAKQTYPDDKTL